MDVDWQIHLRSSIQRVLLSFSRLESDGSPQRTLRSQHRHTTWYLQEPDYRSFFLNVINWNYTPKIFSIGHSSPHHKARPRRKCPVSARRVPSTTPLSQPREKRRASQHCSAFHSRDQHAVNVTTTAFDRGPGVSTIGRTSHIHWPPACAVYANQLCAKPAP